MRAPDPLATSGSIPARQHRGRAQILRVADRIVSAVGLASRPLSAPELIEAAQRRTGLTNFGDAAFEEPLRVLTRCYEEEAGLSAFGRMAARWDALRLLSNLLLLQRAEEQDPGIRDEPIEQPIFITGLPRSGTTFLHNLFAQDRSTLEVRCWETIYPCPERGSWAATSVSRARKVDRHLAQFARLAPEVRHAHPMSANSLQECTEITAHVFRSLRFDTTHHVPGYRRWLDEVGHLEAYRFHRRFLRYLQHQKGPGRWVLKCPDHVFALDAIRTVYPDARFIFLHRSPLDMLPSVAELTEILRRPFAYNVDRIAIGRQVSEHWARGAELLLSAANDSRASPDRVAHLEFAALVADPLGTLAALYERFGLPFSDELAERVRGFVAGWLDGERYRRDKTPMEEYGLEAATERYCNRAYMARFGF